MKRILLDTNFLVDMVRFRVDLNEIENILEEPYELSTLDLVIDELKKIKSKDAKVALELIKLKGIKVLKSKKTDVDDAIVALADKSTIVATNDIELRKRLKTKTIYLRARKYLGIS